MSKKAKIAKNNEEKIYEIGYHLISSISEENVPVEIEKIKAVLAKENAVIISEEVAKLRALAYSIKKSFSGVYKTFDKAYFGFIKFELPEGGDIEKIHSALKSNESILRFILIRTERENTMYSPKISVFQDKEGKLRAPAVKTDKPEKIEIPSTVEEIDRAVEALVGEEAVI